MNWTLLKRPRILILLFFLLIALLSINPSFGREGIAIKSIEPLSDAANAGIIVPANLNPKNREIIQSINNVEVKDIDSYLAELEKVNYNKTVRLTTDKNSYIIVKNSEHLGISIDKIVNSNIRKGLDLEGGTRVILEPEEKLTDAEFTTLMQVMENRLNAYGLSDVPIRKASDLSGNNFVIVEVAGATREDVEDLIASQGKFEAKIGNETVFTGSKEDIVSVCKDDGTCSGITNCRQAEGAQYQCTFEFAVQLSPKAAKSHAEVTSKLEVNSTFANYLSKPLDLYVDGKSISPSLGESFFKNALLAGLAALVTVCIVIYIRYRRIKVIIPMIITLLSELFIIVGLASLFKQSIDVAAIAGIIAAVGTGIDDQIVIADEIIKGDQTPLKQSIKKAFFIIMVAY